jgi:hypothetical protein
MRPAKFGYHSFFILGTLGILFCCPFLKHAVSAAVQLGLESKGFLFLLDNAGVIGMLYPSISVP